MDVVLIGTAGVVGVMGLFYLIARGPKRDKIEDAPALETLQRAVPPIHSGPSG